MNILLIRSSWYGFLKRSCVEKYEVDSMLHDENKNWVSGMPILQHLKIDIASFGTNYEIQFLNGDKKVK